jgi:hypothetical protein
MPNYFYYDLYYTNNLIFLAATSRKNSAKKRDAQSKDGKNS